MALRACREGGNNHSGGSEDLAPFTLFWLLFIVYQHLLRLSELKKLLLESLSSKVVYGDASEGDRGQFGCDILLFFFSITENKVLKGAENLKSQPANTPSTYKVFVATINRSSSGVLSLKGLKHQKYQLVISKFLGEIPLAKLSIVI